MAPPMQSTAIRRDPPNFVMQHGLRWRGLLEQRGYFYVGDTGHPGTLRVPSWRPSRVVAVDPDGEPTVWENGCRHHGLQLVPAYDTLVHLPWNHEIKCPWHAMKYGPRGEVTSPGIIRLTLDQLPEHTCPSKEILMWQGLVFELGQDPAARFELAGSLAYVELVAGHVFNFQDFVLKKSVRAPQVLPDGRTADAFTSTDNYLDVTHVPRHAGNLAQLVDLGSAAYTYFPEGETPDKVVVQFMRPHRDWRMTEFGQRYSDCGMPDPPCGAAWVTTRMGLMLEYYPGVIVVSQCFPHPERWWECTFYHDFYYHKLAGDRFIECHQDIFDQTGQEDLLWCSGATQHIRDRIEQGRGHEPWGFFDPRAENFGPWYSRQVRELLELK